MTVALLKRKGFQIAVIAGAAIIAAALIIAHYLPVYIETRLVPRWTAEAGFDPADLHIRRVDIDGADLGPFSLGLNDTPFLEIAAVQVDYAIGSLLKREIETIVLSGVSLTLTLNDQGNAILGFESLPQAPTEKQQFSLEQLSRRLPFSLDRLLIRNAVATVQWRGERIVLPIQADLDCSNVKQGRVDGSARIFLRGNTFTITAAMDDRGNTLGLTLQGQQVALESFADMVRERVPWSVRGRVDLDAQASFTMQPPALTSIAATTRVMQADFHTDAVAISNRPSDDGSEQPIEIKAISSDGKQWQWTAAPFLINQPMVVQVARMEGHLTQDNQAWQLLANVRTIVTAQPITIGDDRSVVLSQPLAFQWSLAASQGAENSVQVEAHGQTAGNPQTDNVALRRGQIRLSGHAPYISLAGRFHGRDDIQAHVEAGLGRVEGHSGPTRVACAKLALSGDLTTARRPQVKVNIRVPETVLAIADRSVTAATIQVDAVLSKKESGQWHGTGLLQQTGGTMKDPANALQVKAFAFRQPLQWPLSDKTPAGELSAGPIFWKSNEIGGIVGKVKLMPDALSADISHASKLFPGMIVHIKSKADASGISATADVPPYSPSSEIDIGRLFPELDWARGMTVNGQVAGQLRLTAQGETIQAAAWIKLNDGSIRQLRQELTLDGIDCEMTVADLMKMRSGPGQRLKVDKLTMGTTGFENLEVAFQLEPEDTLFIEKMTLRWCGGKVQSGAVRLKPDLEDLSATLYCDRLNLAKVLDQLGIAKGTGEGNVNGRIPVHWRKGELSFDDGFLYSTPGQTGTIQLSDTDMLLKGLPPGSPQLVQMKIASEALRDYIYNWAKLTIQSKDERLLVTLDLDGRPNRLLPFAYNPQTGSLEPVDTDGEADFKGIGLTINSNIPFNQILRYKGLLKTQ